MAPSRSACRSCRSAAPAPSASRAQQRLHGHLLRAQQPPRRSFLVHGDVQHHGTVAVHHGQQRRLLVDELLELAAQLGDVRVAGLEDLIDLGDIEQRQQQVLDRHELVSFFPGLLEGQIQGKLQLFT